MAIRIRFTHPFDLLMKLVIWVASIATGIAFVGLLSFAGLETDSGIFEIILFFVGTVISSIFFTKWINPFSTKCYLSAFCGTNVTYHEAEELAFLFDGSLGGKWYPFTDLKNIPKEYRKKILFEFINKMWGYATQYEKTQKNTQTSSSQNESYYNKSTQNTRTEETKSTNTKEKIYPNNYMLACNIMGLNFNLTKDELKSKYRELMKQYHPDLYSGENYEMKKFAEAKTIEINTAYEYLSAYFDKK